MRWAKHQSAMAVVISKNVGPASPSRRACAIQFGDRRAKFLHSPGEIVGADRLAVPADALFDPLQMRRCEQPDVDPGGGDDRADHRRCRTFALSSGDMDDRVAVLRVSEQPEQLAHPVQPEFPFAVGDQCGPLVVDAAMQIVERGGVTGGFGHGSSGKEGRPAILGDPSPGSQRMTRRGGRGFRVRVSGFGSGIPSFFVSPVDFEI
ncbi:MAG: hypothetical protein QM811_01825 [Pirellulales bacterium]